MKDAWDKLKIVSEVFKNNWPQFLLIGTLLSSAGFNLNQYFGIQEKEVEIQNTQKQITKIAEHYAAPKTVKVKTICNCGKLWRRHMKEDH